MIEICDLVSIIEGMQLNIDFLLIENAERQEEIKVLKERFPRTPSKEIF